MTELNNLCVISQSVFDALMDIDEETFRLSLREKGLVEEEADAACIRLKNLKDKVINDKGASHLFLLKNDKINCPIRLTQSLRIVTKI